MYRLFCFEGGSMKILYVISDHNIGGAGVLTCNILRHLDPLRFSAVVALPFGSALRERVLSLGFPVKELQYPADRYSWDSVRELIRIAWEERVDLIHANAALCARIAGKLCGKKVVHTRHCYYRLEERGFSPIWAAERLGNRMLSNRVIATADAAAENLKAMGIPQKKITVIVNGSDEVREVSDGELEEWRKRLNLRKTDFCVGICARLEPCKGHSVFLKAARIALERMPNRNLRFLIVGDGSLREELLLLTQREGIAEAVRFVGFVPDPAPLYRLLRINVNASWGTETSCLAISEGMSASLPTVASAYGGNRAMLGESGAGICVPTGDANALASAICRIASDAVLERQMRAASRARFEECFTAARMTAQIEAVYDSLR